MRVSQSDTARSPIVLDGFREGDECQLHLICSWGKDRPRAGGRGRSESTHGKLPTAFARARHSRTRRSQGMGSDGSCCTESHGRPRPSRTCTFDTARGPFAVLAQGDGVGRRPRDRSLRKQRRSNPRSVSRARSTAAYPNRSAAATSSRELVLLQARVCEAGETWAADRLTTVPGSAPGTRNEGHTSRSGLGEHHEALTAEPLGDRDGADLSRRLGGVIEAHDGCP